ncbi:hypothetical protein STENM223S_02327 [Streptomyces tendae]
MGPLGEVTLTTTKLPSTLEQPWMDQETLARLRSATGPVEVMAGTALTYVWPSSPGPPTSPPPWPSRSATSTRRVRVVADPAAAHSPRRRGERAAGRVPLRGAPLPHPANPATSQVVPYAVLRSLAALAGRREIRDRPRPRRAAPGGDRRRRAAGAVPARHRLLVRRLRPADRRPRRRGTPGRPPGTPPATASPPTRTATSPSTTTPTPPPPRPGARAGQAHVVGVSWGGVIALRLATLHPDLVASLTVADSTPGSGTSPEKAAAMRARVPELERVGARAFAEERGPPGRRPRTRRPHWCGGSSTPWPTRSARPATGRPAS